MMELVSEAIVFAVKAHDGMRRKKSDAPYILHPMEAAVIVGSMKVVNVCAEVMEVFEMTGFADILVIE